MNPRAHKAEMNRGFRQLIMTMTIMSLITACATTTARTVRQQDLDVWVGVSVEALDTHPFFMNAPMFRTRTDSGTEIRNYAYGYNFGECFDKAGGNQVGDFVNEDVFTACSSSGVVCNNFFYIKDEKIIEYAPTGRCYTEAKFQPEARYLTLKDQ